MKISGFIFDFDGTLVDTQIQIHGFAQSKVLALHGIHLTAEQISEKYAGLPSNQLFTEYLPHANPDILVREKRTLMDQILDTIDYSSLDMLSAAVKHLRVKDYKIAIASASPKEYVTKMLDRIIVDGEKYSTFFDAIICTEDVSRPKPFPDVFLKAAELIGKSPDECIVVGDARSDVESAIAASMRCLYLSTLKVFDGNQIVTRFSSKESLSQYLIERF